MTARLGNVLYWTACLCALGWVVMAYFGISTMKPPDWSLFWVLGLAPAVGIWLLGRAARYVLTGA